MNEDNLPCFNFDYHDWVIIRIIRKYYPHLKNKKELSLLACIAWTMKDFDWSVADDTEVEARMTENLILEETNGSKSEDTTTSTRLLQPEEYKEILSHLISEKIVHQKMLLTRYGFYPREKLQNDEYLVFTNNDMTNEILRNSEILDLMMQEYISWINNEKMR